MTFARTFDMELVRTIMTHPEIYPWISDDGCPPAEEFQPQEHSAIWYVQAMDASETLGIFVLSPQGVACWEFHTVLLPSAWGKCAVAAMKAMFEWVWTNTPCRRLITNVPVNNRRARWIARAVGLTQFGLNPGSFLKDNVLYDQMLFGLSKPEVISCQQP